MFFIYTSAPEGDHMARYERDKLDDIFGEYNSTQLAILACKIMKGEPLPAMAA